MQRWTPGAQVRESRHDSSRRSPATRARPSRRPPEQASVRELPGARLEGGCIALQPASGERLRSQRASGIGALFIRSRAPRGGVRAVSHGLIERIAGRHELPAGERLGGCLGEAIGRTADIPLRGAQHRGGAREIDVVAGGPRTAGCALLMLARFGGASRERQHLDEGGRRPGAHGERPEPLGDHRSDRPGQRLTRRASLERDPREQMRMLSAHSVVLTRERPVDRRRAPWTGRHPKPREPPAGRIRR